MEGATAEKQNHQEKITMSLFPIGRKAKDLRDLERAKKSGGSVTIRSKGKITNPTNPAQSLGRGSTVTYTKTPVMKKDPDTVIPGKHSVSVNKGERVIYQPGDFNQGKVHDRPTTPELGKSLGENPEKTSRRIESQKSGETDYDAGGGKREYSGRTIKKPTTEYTVTKSPDRTKIGNVSIGEKTDVTVEATASKSKSEKSGGRSGLVTHVSAGTNRKGNPQNYRSFELGGKKLFRVPVHTPGSMRRR